MKAFRNILIGLMLCSAAWAQNERGDTSYTANYFLGMEKVQNGYICRDMEVKVDIRKEVPLWVRKALLKDLEDKLKPSLHENYPPEDSLFKACSDWETQKVSLISEILFWEPDDQMCLVFYVDEEDCCDPKKNKRIAYVRNVDLKNQTFYDLEAFYKKHKERLDQDVMSHVRRKYRSNRDRRFIRMIQIEEVPPLGFDKRGLIVFTVSTIGGKYQHVPWVVSHARLPEPLPVK